MTAKIFMLFIYTLKNKNYSIFYSTYLIINYLKKDRYYQSIVKFYQI